ncbi:MAG: HAD family hydrolase [Lachnospiraceae bacterium]|nr:HAD family hydrolase [Lachnospiraceae bacterium]
MSVKNVIFDLDGTLLYTLQDLCDAVNFVLKENNEPARSLAEIRSFVGNGVHKLMERSVPAGTSAEYLEDQYHEFRKYYSTHDRETTVPFEGIPELLTELHRRGIKVAVVTNKFQLVAGPMMQDFFGDLIDVTVGAEENIPHKPEPYMVYKAINRLEGEGGREAEAGGTIEPGGIAGAAGEPGGNALSAAGESDGSAGCEPLAASLYREPAADVKAHTLYVGDSTVDAATAENSGLSYLLCDWGYNDRDVLEQQHARAIVSSPEQILDYLN